MTMDGLPATDHRLLARAALFGGLLAARGLHTPEVERGIDERDVREGLREISDLSFDARIVLLGEQSDIIAQCEKVLEHPARVLMPAEQHVIVGEPEAA